MYGYIIPDKTKLYNKDFLLFRSFYCGVCKSIAATSGNLPRFSTNYDIAFLAALIHAYKNHMPEYSCEGCILNPFKKKHVVKQSELMQRIVSLNTLLSYHNILDKIADKDKGKLKAKLAKRVMKKAYFSAREILPQADNILQKSFEKLRELEKENSKSIDRVSDCFASGFRDCVVKSFDIQNDYNFEDVIYNIAKFVYLADALDDINDDAKKKHYNPFLARYGQYKNKAELIKEHRQDIEFIINMTINRAIESYNKLNVCEGRDLLNNIFYFGLRRKAELLINSPKKQKRERV